MRKLSLLIKTSFLRGGSLLVLMSWGVLQLQSFCVFFFVPDTEKVKSLLADVEFQISALLKFEIKDLFLEFCCYLLSYFL